jgi:hypothetical protein
MKVLDEMQRILARFLWLGNSTKGLVTVRWEQCCLPITEGGLGVRSPREWSIVGFMQRLWQLLVDEDTLWVKWMRAKYLKGSSIWTARPPSNASWGWKGMLSVRNFLLPHISYQIGNGDSILLFQDPGAFGDSVWGEITL